MYSRGHGDTSCIPNCVKFFGKVYTIPGKDRKIPVLSEFRIVYLREQRARWLPADIWRLPRGSNTLPLWGELAKKKLSHAPLLAAGLLI